MKEATEQDGPLRNIWILDEGSQGHIVQSRGLTRELGKEANLNINEIEIRSKLYNKLWKSMTKRLLRSVRSIHFFNYVYQHPKLPESRPELIISSGPHSLPALEFLARYHCCPSVLVQGTIHVAEGSVTAVMRPFEGEYRNDYIFIPLLFTEITPASVEMAKAEYLSSVFTLPSRPLYTLFIGNSSNKIEFSQTDWDGIIELINRLWMSDGCQWLITTSYRTGPDIESHFKKNIEPAAIFEAVWYSENPRKVTQAFLGMAERVFVTMDSLTMLTEAVASGRPTCALSPHSSTGQPANTHLEYVKYLNHNGYITQFQIGGPALIYPTPRTPALIDYSPAIRLLLTRLQWNP